MTLAATFCEQHLAMPLGIAGAIDVAAPVVAMGAGYALAVVRRAPVGSAQRPSAGAAEYGLAFGQPMADGDALVEDEALALPQALLRRPGLQVLQDAALEVID